MGRPREALEGRFWRHVRKQEGCWIWTGALLNGYGRLPFGTTIKGRRIRANLLAHRVAWEIHHGSIPDEMCVLHKCDNPPCVNVGHLFLGTHADNVADKVAKERQNRGETHGRRKLTTAQVRRILADARTHADIAKTYGVTQGHITDIKNGKKWAHVRT